HRFPTRRSSELVIRADLDGPVVSHGKKPNSEEVDSLLSQVFEYGGGARGDLPNGTAVYVSPLVVADELSGALVAVGDPVEADVDAAASLVSDYLDHAALRRVRSRIAAADLRTLRAQISPHCVHNSPAVLSAPVHTDPDRTRTL